MGPFEVLSSFWSKLWHSRLPTSTCQSPTIAGEAMDVMVPVSSRQTIRNQECERRYGKVKRIVKEIRRSRNKFWKDESGNWKAASVTPNGTKGKRIGKHLVWVAVILRTFASWRSSLAWRWSSVSASSLSLVLSCIQHILMCRPPTSASSYNMRCQSPTSASSYNMFWGVSLHPQPCPLLHTQCTELSASSFSLVLSCI